MRSGRRFMVLAVLVVTVSVLVGAPTPVEACGYVKCEPPGSGGCWECTYSLYLFQRCRYWCKTVPSGAIHSSCWEEDCFEPVDLNAGSEVTQLAALGLTEMIACPAVTEDESGGESAEPSSYERPNVRAVHLPPRT